MITKTNQRLHSRFNCQARWGSVGLFCLSVFLLTACVFPIQPPTPNLAVTSSPRQRLPLIKDYMVYYEKGREDELARFDLAIIQPDTLNAAALRKLKATGTLVIAYLSIGEVEPERPWYDDGRVEQSWVLGKNENWGSYYVDASQPGWQALMQTLTGEYLAQGFDGVFLDTVDTVDAFPATQAGMVALIQQLRTAYPKAILVQNRGFRVIDETATAIDGVMFEDLSTSYDFASQEYGYADNQGVAEQMVALHNKTGLTILALDYVALENHGGAARAVKIAQAYGFVPAVSTILLDDIPDYGLAQGGPADLRISRLTATLRGETTTIVAIVENIGLSDAVAVPLQLAINRTPLISTTHDFPVGERFTWETPWPKAENGAQIMVSTSFQDGDDSNNINEMTFQATAMAVEPLLPLAEQQRWPAANGPDLVATQLSAPIAVDGDLADWAGLPCTEVNQPAQLSWGDKAGWLGPTDLSGTICYGWDADNLYIGISIKDDVIVQLHTGTDLWQGDHVELWFDTQLQLDFASAEASDDDYQLGFSPGDGAQVPADFTIFQPALARESYIDLVEFKVTRTAEGYTIEARIPIGVLAGLRVAPDHAIGATFEPSDTDTPNSSEQELMMSSAPQSSANWGAPTLWNNLIFQAR